MVVCGVGLASLAPAGASQGHHGERRDSGPAASTSIIGGNDASIAALPWLVEIDAFNRRGSGFGCTGTVIAPRLVLTAGHCVLSLETGRTYPATQYTVTIGAGDLRTATAANQFAVSQVLVFPQFSTATLRNDAGLLVLEKPTSAPPLAIAEGAGSTLAAGTPLLIAGWGLTAGRARQTPALLQYAETFAQSASYCRQNTRRYAPYFLPARQFCAVNPPSFSTGTCHGDSGGPAIAARNDGSLVQVGITSSGAPACATASPQIFTRVDQVASWVFEWIAAVEAGAPAPPIPVTRRELPFLSFPVAKELAYIGLSEDFGRRFTHGRSKEIGCRRVEREKVKCGVGWYRGANDYWGTITLYIAVSENEIVWDDRYRIHWVNDYCWYYSGHRNRCRIHTQYR